MAKRVMWAHTKGSFGFMALPPIKRSTVMKSNITEQSTLRWLVPAATQTGAWHRGWGLGDLCKLTWPARGEEP